MKRQQKPSWEDASVDVTPMLDIVFILLIFFIVTASFLDEVGIDLTQPPPAPAPETTLKVPQILVQLDADNQCWVQGRLRECQYVVSHVQLAKFDQPNGVVILQVHARSDHGAMVLLKDQLDQERFRARIEITHLDANILKETSHERHRLLKARTPNPTSNPIHAY